MVKDVESSDRRCADDLSRVGKNHQNLLCEGWNKEKFFDHVLLSNPRIITRLQIIASVFSAFYHC